MFAVRKLGGGGGGGKGVHRIFERVGRGVGAKRRLRGYSRKQSKLQQGPRGAVPGQFLNGLHAKPIGYQYGRFKAVD